MTDQVTQEQIEQARANLTGFGVNPDQLPLEQICGLALHFKPQKTQFDHMREMREANQKTAATRTAQRLQAEAQLSRMIARAAMAEILPSFDSWDD